MDIHHTGEEALYNPTESRAKLEKKELPIEIFNALTSALKIHGEGKEGVVFRLNVAELDEHIRGNIEALIGESLSEKAVKLLKIYQSNAAIQEARSQMHARTIVESRRKDNPDEANLLAEIPHISGVFDVNIANASEPTITYLQNHRVDVISDTVGLIVMDYIEGDNFYIHLLRELAKNHPVLQDIARSRGIDANTIGFKELKQLVESGLDVPLPDQTDCPLNRFPGSVNQLKHHLKDAGVYPDTHIFQTIKRTL